MASLENDIIEKSLQIQAFLEDLMNVNENKEIFCNIICGGAVYFICLHPNCSITKPLPDESQP